MNITLNHGSGGRVSQQLIEQLFVKYFNNPILEQLTDSALLPYSAYSLAFTTDAYVVDPIFFPGGNIGKLAVCGTINDLAVSGAIPKYLSSSFIIEEGFAFSDLEKIVKSMHEIALQTDVKIVAGDTKVVPKGKCDKIFITTSGVGIIEEKYMPIGSGSRVKVGDKIIVNGTLGDHAISILASRESLHFETPVISDCAPLSELIHQVLEVCPHVCFMRDITRGGIATVANELAQKISLGINLDETQIPISESVAGICEIFGFDPLFLANEGKILLVVPANEAIKVLEIMHKNQFGQKASIIGEIVSEHPRKVVLNTITRGKRILETPAGVQLPRIC